MTSWTRGSRGVLAGAMVCLGASGCLLEDPNMDGILSMTPLTSASGTAGTSPDSDGTATDDGQTSALPTSGTATGTTIFDIQMGAVTEGTMVTLENVVVVSPVRAEQNAVVVQDPAGGPYSAIYLYLFDEVLQGVPLAEGDQLTITGEYSEFFDSSQVTIADVGDIQITGTATIPAPVDVSTAEIVAGAPTAEQYESVPVCVTNVTATDATNQFGDFHIDDGAAVSNFFLLGGADFLQVQPGTTFGRLCGPLFYSFEEFKIAPRGAADYDGDLASCADSATPATIYELQQGMVALDAQVLVEGAVVTSPFDTDGDVFWVQDPAGGEYSGISVYMPASDGFTPTIGDQVTLCGGYAEFFDQSQIQIAAAADVSVTGQAGVPAAEVLSPDAIGGGPMAEAWEGVLVEVQAVTVSAAANMNGEWTVDDVLLVAPIFLQGMAWPSPAIDDMFSSITGVLVFSFDEYKLAPRTAADIAG